jgi:hypothetical protein
MCPNFMAVPVNSGQQWEEDPAGAHVAHPGRTISRFMRAKANPTRVAIVKRPNPAVAHTAEIYSIGFERVAYALADAVGLPVPATYLEVVDGHPSSVQTRVLNARSWLQIGGAPSMKDNIENRNLWPLAALFDVWLGNTDRRDMNFVFEPIPAGATPGRARGSKFWLIDHGMCGLFPAGKFDQARAPHDLPEDPAIVASGRLTADAEQFIAAQMPPEYRMALKNTQGDTRTALLDRLRAVGDHAIDQGVSAVPRTYFTTGQADATAALLKCRQGALATVLEDYW